MLLDLANFLHGVIGLVYVYLLDRCDYRFTCPELYYLLVVYMWGAVICTLIKTIRYFWLFHLLLARESKRERKYIKENSIEHDL